MKKYVLFFSACILIMSSCKKEQDPPPSNPAPAPKLIFKFRFDSTQVRLDNLGNPSTIPGSNRAQSPVFNKMSAHYIEFAQNDFTAVGSGEQVYLAAQTSAGGSPAIDFDQQTKVGERETFFSIPIADITPGSYKWLRVSLAYQNYDIVFKSNTYIGTGTLASFIGFNTYIADYVIATQTINVNDDKLQGYWGFETTIPGFGVYTTTGQAPPGSTTVVNPISGTSPIPPGSCLVTGQFADVNGNPMNLTITGSETKDIIITVSLSTNNSFEWVENSGDNYYEPQAGDTVVDMGIRGMIPLIDPQ